MRAVIFDMDGVLSDTQTLHATIEVALIAEYGGHATADELSRNYAGVPTRTFLPKFIAVTEAQLDTIMQEKERRFRDAISKGVPAVPGALELVRRIHARGVPLAIASGSGPNTVGATLDGLGIRDLFDAIVTSADVLHGKPAPDVFLEAARRMNVAPAQCVVIEDGVSGMVGGRAAGMRVIALATHDRVYPADIVVHSLSEITDEMLSR